MTIGTSLGGFFHTEADMHMAPLARDNNIIDPDTTPDIGSDDNNVKPMPQPTDKATTIPVSDVYSISPMNDTENGVIPLGGAPERVGKAAVVIQGKTYTGQNHGFALSQFMDENPNINVNEALKGYRDGFVTNKGRFVSREEAFDIAKDQNQIQDKVLPALTEESKMLLSEDLKPIK